MTRRKSNVAGKKEKNRKINLQGRELDLSKFSGKEGSNRWILAIAVMIGFSALVPLPPPPPPACVFVNKRPNCVGFVIDASDTEAIDVE